MSIDEEFFSGSTKSKAPKGIPGFEMNRPVVQNPYVGTIGLELEIEGRGLINEGYLDGIRGKTSRAFWTTHQDGSLRGEAREYVLSQPCKVEELPDLLNGLWEVFGRNGTVINNSNRCSTHVHVNMSGYRINQLTSILALWTTFEEALIKWHGETRQTNHFCLSAKDVVSTMASWNELIQTGKLPSDRNLKYTSLNILPLWQFGSFEFRCGAAADSAAMPITWATFLHHFCKYAAETFADPQTIAFALSERGGMELFSDVCRKAGMEQFRDEVVKLNPYFDRSAIEGFRLAQPFVMGAPWNEWMDLINREYVPNPFASKAKKVPRPGGVRIENIAMPPEPQVGRAPMDEVFHGMLPRDRVNGDRWYHNELGRWLVQNRGRAEIDTARRGLDRDLNPQ